LEQYQQELECDRELYQVIALDAKGLAHSRITARQAANLLAEASQKANGPAATANTTKRETPSEKNTATQRADASQQRIVTSH
jgi:topoisomerase IA-like protein